MSVATFLTAQKLEVSTEPCQGLTVSWTSRPLDLPRAGYESKSRKVSPLHLQKWNALSVCMASWSLTHQTLDFTEPKFWNSWRHHPVLNSLLNIFMTIFKRFLFRNSKVQKVLSQNLQSWFSLDGLKHNYCNYLREVRLSIPQPTLQELPEKLSQLSIQPKN